MCPARHGCGPVRLGRRPEGIQGGRTKRSRIGEVNVYVSAIPHAGGFAVSFRSIYSSVVKFYDNNGIHLQDVKDIQLPSYADGTEGTAVVFQREDRGSNYTSGVISATTFGRGRHRRTSPTPRTSRWWRAPSLSRATTTTTRKKQQGFTGSRRHEARFADHQHLPEDRRQRR